MDYITYNMERFVAAQEKAYPIALEEIKQGRRVSHWMWFIFPQHKNLGFSCMAKFYGISNMNEAAEYLKHILLYQRLKEVSKTLLNHKDRPVIDIFWKTDALKLKSSMTLFDLIQPNDIFNDVLLAFYNGRRDTKTIQLLAKDN